MTVLKILLLILAGFFIVATILPLLRHEAWWIRIFDFPRIQIAIAGVIILAVYLLVWDTKRLVETIVLGVLVLCVVYQSARMLRFTPVTPKQVMTAEEIVEERTFSLLIANVLMTNREAPALIELVRRYNPDVLLTVETDAWWEEQLRKLEERYPHVIKHPLHNTYGMLLYSRLPLLDPELRFVVKDSIPSMHARIRLESGDEVYFHALHPEPPYPKYAKETTERDAELLIIGKEVEERAAPTIVAGDMNDVAWSYTTTLFQKISGLLDPRKGRGMYNTFHAGNPFMRWPLDHVFHSDHFKLIRLERLPAWGSDHFPVFIDLAMDPLGEIEQEEPKADTEDRKEAEEKIEEAEAKSGTDKR